MGERDRFMQEILDREWEMFQKVKKCDPCRLPKLSGHISKGAW